jgi:hypothetical protein
MSGRSRGAIAEIGVRGAQLCKTSKAGVASFAEVRAGNIKDGPAPFESRDSIGSATNSNFAHLSSVSDFSAPYKEMKYESSCCPPIRRS